MVALATIVALLVPLKMESDEVTGAAWAECKRESEARAGRTRGNMAERQELNKNG